MSCQDHYYVKESKTNPFIKRGEVKISCRKDPYYKNQTSEKRSRKTYIVRWGKTGHSKDDSSHEGTYDLEGMDNERRKESDESPRRETETGNSQTNIVQNPIRINPT